MVEETRECENGKNEKQLRKEKKPQTYLYLILVDENANWACERCQWEEVVHLDNISTKAKTIGASTADGVL